MTVLHAADYFRGKVFGFVRLCSQVNDLGFLFRLGLLPLLLGEVDRLIL